MRKVGKFLCVLLMLGFMPFAAHASDIAPNTAQATHAGNTLDSNWNVAFLGNFGIGTEDNLGPVPSKAAIWSKILWEKAIFGFKDASVYNPAEWPLAPPPMGSTETPWVQPFSVDPLGYNVGWIGADCDNTDYQDGSYGSIITNDPGYYAFSLSFCLDPCSQVCFNMLLDSDNAIDYILFNGQYLDFDPNAFDAYADPAIGYDTGFLTASFTGWNELIFVVSNAGNDKNYGNPVGLYVDFLRCEFTNATPEPATLFLFGLGGVGAIAARRRVRK